jgi:multiple sugar transport system ATP-binding protein
MADRIVVMRDGAILQVGTPTDLYENPIDVFTARFIGSPAMNLLRGTMEGEAVVVVGATSKLSFLPAAGGPSRDLLVGIRPHELIVGAPTNPDGLSVSGLVSAVEPLGAETLVHIETRDGEVIATTSGKTIPAIESAVTAAAAPGALYLFDAITEQAFGRA